jgi:ribosomal peptide maturation radical SAM protein 1
MLLRLNRSATKRDEMEPIVLVCAPFFSVVRPALGVSLLKAALEQVQIPTRIEYLNLRFANRIGVDFHESAATGVANTLLVGEWVFASLVNRDARPAQEQEYLDSLRAVYSERHLAQLGSLRESALDFVEEESRRLAAEAPCILGFTTSFQQNCASIAIARRVRELNSAITICFGGANCEGSMGRALLEAFPEIDYVFSGEADHTFPEFVRNFLAKKSPLPTSSGVYSRLAEPASRLPEPVRIDTTPKTTMVSGLDSLPTPDFSDYFQTLRDSAFHDRILPGLVFESSRGCWWGAKKHCRFCGLNGSTMTYRPKSPARIMEELEQLSNTWSVPRFLAVDNIMDMKHIESVFGVLGVGQPAYRFFYETKSNLTRDQLEHLARGGVTWFQPGIESLDDEILEEMQKGVTALQNICLLRNSAELGMRPVWAILCGFPGERPEQYEHMASITPLLEHLEPPNGCQPIRLDRFSPYFERSAELGFSDVRPVPAYAGVYALEPEVISRLAYFFEGTRSSGASQDYAEPLTQAVARWTERFYRNAEPPVLSSVNFGIGLLLEDTRSCTAERWRCLNDDEAMMLKAFREPKNIRATLNRLNVAMTAETEADTVFNRLVDWKYILIDNDRALSLVAERNETVTGHRTDSEFPGGCLLPPRNWPQAR